jgi:unsaturated chondroitin disaccharide hydrolase
MFLKKSVLTTILFVTCFIAESQNVKKIMSDAEKQINLFYYECVAARNARQQFPRTLRNDSIRLVVSDDWTSGFFPGMLWFMYEYTRKNEWKVKAEEFTTLMEREPKNRGSHDVGFKVYNSYGNGYRLTQNELYKQQVIQGAKTLISRYNANVGCIRSWDFGRWQFPVIVDNMMNLELLFAATRFSGDSIYYKVAVSHADLTLKNHYRDDNSSFHVVDYDTVSGNVRGKGTLQGNADSSTWARGQAWGLYGFTMCYRETRNPEYLLQAEKIAAFLMKHPRLPSDYIPYWDFDLPEFKNEPRDVSAATIIASALYELQSYSKSGRKYKVFADRILSNVTRNYRAPAGSAKGFLLLHSTGNKPAKSEVDVPLIYADYYFLEALLRKGKRGKL